MSFISISISPLIIHIYTVSGSSLYSKHTLQNSASHWTETLRVIACGCLLAYSFNCTVDTKTIIVVSFNIDKTLFAISKDSGTSKLHYIYYLPSILRMRVAILLAMCNTVSL